MPKGAAEYASNSGGSGGYSVSDCVEDLLNSLLNSIPDLIDFISTDLLPYLGDSFNDVVDYMQDTEDGFWNVIFAIGAFGFTLTEIFNEIGLALDATVAYLSEIFSIITTYMLTHPVQFACLVAMSVSLYFILDIDEIAVSYTHLRAHET